MDFLLSNTGQYLGQTILHSFLIALIVEVIIRSSRIQEPLLQIKFRSLSLWLPVLYLPILFFSYPPRADTYFHQQVSLFDSNQWLSLRLGGGVALWHLIAAMVAVTVGFFMVRELIPLVSYNVNRRTALPVLEKGRFPKLDVVLADLAKKRGLSEPAVLLSGETAPSVSTLGRKALVLSMSAIELLDAEELEAVIAHELAHFTREILVIGRICLALRFLMFYNPVALLVYHRINHDTEKFCDDLAISFTGKRLALVSGLLKILRHITVGTSISRTAQRRWWRSLAVYSFESQAHLALAKERAERILHREKVSIDSYQSQRLAITAGLLMAALFFVV